MNSINNKCMMGFWLLCGFLFSNSINVYSQSGSNDRWELAKNVWSHRHQEAGKRLLDFDVMDNWKGLGGDVVVSPNGKHFAYTTTCIESYNIIPDSMC